MDITEERTGLAEVLVGIARKEQFRKKAIKWGVISLLLIAALVTAGLWGGNTVKASMTEQIDALHDEIAEKEKQIEELLRNPIVVNPVAPEIELDLIKSEIQEIAELATMQYLFTDAARFSDSAYLGDWKVPFTEKSFTLKWDGVIKAGVNLENVQISVDESAMKIVVTLPAAQILSYEIDNESIEKLDEKNNVFNPISVDDKVKLDTATEKEMRERAIQNGLLEKAWENAKDIITRLLTANAAIGDAYTVAFVKE